MLRCLLAALPIAWLPALAAAAPTSIVLLGDSITQGLVSEPLGPSYAALLADSLGPEFAVANIGCGGASSLDWTRSRGDVICGGIGFVEPNLYEGRALPELPADIVTILLGTNDALGFFEPQPVAPDVYRDAIAEIAADLLLDGAGRIVLMTPPPNFVFPQVAGTLGAYRDHILDLCAAPGDALLCGPDVFTLLTPQDFAIDDIHPNAFGHQKIADALHEAILATVPEPGSAPLLAFGLAAFGLGRRRARSEQALVDGLRGAAYRRPSGFEKPGDFRRLQTREPLDPRLFSGRPGTPHPFC